MNHISIILYLADIAEKIMILGWISVALMIAYSIFVLFACTNANIKTDLTLEEKQKTLEEKQKKLAAHGKKWFFRSLIVAAICMLIPTKTTLYMIAASEATESVVTSNQGKEILNSLSSMIKESVTGENNG